MKTRKQKELEKVNMLLEKRYLEKRCINEIEDIENDITLSVTPIKIKGPVENWKISLFIEKNDTGMKDIMNDDILEKFNLKKQYVDQLDPQNDINKVNIDLLKKEIEKMDY